MRRMIVVVGIVGLLAACSAGKSTPTHEQVDTPPVVVEPSRDVPRDVSPPRSMHQYHVTHHHYHHYYHRHHHHHHYVMHRHQHPKHRV
jgi:hypothetical protein